MYTLCMNVYMRDVCIFSEVVDPALLCTFTHAILTEQATEHVVQKRCLSPWIIR